MLHSNIVVNKPREKGTDVVWARKLSNFAGSASPCTFCEKFGVARFVPVKQVKRV